MLASPIATLSLRAIAIGASAPLAARERPERYEPCTVRCTAKYALRPHHDLQCQSAERGLLASCEQMKGNATSVQIARAANPTRAIVPSEYFGRVFPALFAPHEISLRCLFFTHIDFRI